MKLIIVHYHLRPGGVRRVIDLALPHLARTAPRTVDRVVLATGEADDKDWNALLARQSAPTPVEWFVEPAFQYVSEQKRSSAAIDRRVRRALNRLLAGSDGSNCTVWTHNLSIGHNLLLARAVTDGCARRGIPLVMQHHDWWFDNRWPRWAEMRRSGFRTMAAAAACVFPAKAVVRHVVINQSDAAVLHRHFPRQTFWLPNLTKLLPPPPAPCLRETRRWLAGQLEGERAPVWLMPSRLLRRKNIAEALLLTRWLRPKAWLVTTGDVSSRNEETYASHLAAAACRHGWKLRLGILAGKGFRKPAVAELLHASEAVLLTSIQEGFGLPYLEAAAARRPLIARTLPNILPDLDAFGFKFPQSYADILVPAGLFDWRAEAERQRRLFRAWRDKLPRDCRLLTGETAMPAAAQTPQAAPFSRLTLTAQLEVLARPVAESWDCCLPLNSFLRTWQRRATEGRLQVTPWPQSARTWLGGAAYAERFWGIVAARTPAAPPGAASAAQRDFLGLKLGRDAVFPLLWAARS